MVRVACHKHGGTVCVFQPGWGDWEVGQAPTCWSCIDAALPVLPLPQPTLHLRAAALPAPPCRYGDDTLDSADADEMEGGDLDALAAVDFAGLPPQAFPWAGNPVEAPLGVGEGGTDGAEGSGDASGGSSGSESSEGSSSSDGSEGGISSSGGSGDEAMDEDEEDEWFPGGDVGAY